MSDEPPSFTRAAPMALWRAMGAFLTLLFNLFGPPERVARQGALTTTQRALILSWLRAGEAMLRRLLLIEASALELAPAAPRITRTSAPRAKRPHAFDADAPESWRVSFKCTFVAVRSRPAGQRRHTLAQKPAKERRFAGAWPIAERFEAMLRAYNDPAPCATRLARWITRHPAQAERLIDAPDDAPALFGEESFHVAGQQAEVALRKRRESG